MPVKTIKVLRAARKLVADPKTWTTGGAARDKEDKNVHPGAITAVRWCLDGAVFSACKKFGVNMVGLIDLEDALARIAKRDHGLHLSSSVNDLRGRLAALSILDSAIVELGYKP